MPVPRKVWLQTCVVMPAALARRRTIAQALFRVMVFTFARVSAACGLNVVDIFQQQRRLWVRLHEKGGKFHEMPCHHTLEGYLAECIECARLAEDGQVPLFQAIKCRPYGRGVRDIAQVVAKAATDSQLRQLSLTLAKN